MKFISPTGEVEHHTPLRGDHEATSYPGKVQLQDFAEITCLSGNCGACNACIKRHFDKKAVLAAHEVKNFFDNALSSKGVKDFAGEIDGQGVKAVMTSPKSPLQLITPEILEGLAAVLLHGAGKYAPNNWMRGMSWETVMGGILRHLTAFRRGEEIDKESGLPHLHHATCGLMFLSWYANGPQRSAHEKFDDRGYKVGQ